MSAMELLELSAKVRALRLALEEGRLEISRERRGRLLVLTSELSWLESLLDEERLDRYRSHTG